MELLLAIGFMILIGWVAIKSLKVVYSKEEPIKPIGKSSEDTSARRSTPASISFVPSVAGLMIAGEVIKNLAIKGE